MRAVIQRVSGAEVRVQDKIVGSIGKGIMVLVGFSGIDTPKTFQYMLDKMLQLRIWEDSEGKMNISTQELFGDLLIVPNFTLYGDCRKGRRPGYSDGAPVELARSFYEEFCSLVESSYGKVQKGEFQANMQVSLVNDGPVTLLLDSEKKF